MESLRPSSSAPTIKDVADDFTQIHGIGPGIEHRLHNAGIRTYIQLAEQTPYELAVILKDLTAMKEEWIDAQDWVGQARKLAAESEDASELQTVKPEEIRQHYENFTLEFLLDENNQVRRTRVIHIQTQLENSWPGLEEARLFDYLKENAGISTPQELEKAVMPARARPGRLAEKAPDLPAWPTGEPVAEPRLVDLEAFEPGNNLATRHLHADQPFDLRLTLDPANVNVSAQAPVGYSTTIYAQGVGGSPNRVVGTVQGSMTYPKHVMISLEGARLPMGHYRLEAVVHLTLAPSSSGEAREKMLYLEGGLFQFY